MNFWFIFAATTIGYWAGAYAQTIFHYFGACS